LDHKEGLREPAARFKKVSWWGFREEKKRREVPGGKN